MSKNGWIRFEDRKPTKKDLSEIGEVVIVVKGYSCAVTLMYDIATETFFDESGEDYIVEIWQPLPKTEI